MGTAEEGRPRGAGTIKDFILESTRQKGANPAFQAGQ